MILNIPSDLEHWFILSKSYTDEDGIKYVFHGLSTCMGDNPLAKACGSSPHSGGVTAV